jgi:hypothetical protein
MNRAKYIIIRFLILLISSCNERKEISAFKVSEITYDVMAFLGYSVSEKDSLFDQVKTLHKMNIESNKAYNEILMKSFQVDEETKEKLLIDYINSEPLQYYANLAKETIV